MQPHGVILVVEVGWLSKRAAMSTDGSELLGDRMSVTSVMGSPRTGKLATSAVSESVEVADKHQKEVDDDVVRLSAYSPCQNAKVPASVGDPWRGRDPWRLLLTSTTSTEAQTPTTMTSSAATAQRPASEAPTQTQESKRSETVEPLLTALTPYEGKAMKVATPRIVSTTVAPNQEPTTVEEAVAASSLSEAPTLSAEPQNPVASTTQTSTTSAMSPKTSPPTTHPPGLAAPTQTSTTREPSALDPKNAAVLATVHPPGLAASTIHPPFIAAAQTQTPTVTATSSAATILCPLLPLPTWQPPAPNEAKAIKVATLTTVATTAVVAHAEQPPVSVAPTLESTTVEEAEVATETQRGINLALLGEALGEKAMEIVYQHLEKLAKNAEASLSPEAPMSSAEPRNPTANAATPPRPVASTTKMSTMFAAAPIQTSSMSVAAEEIQRRADGTLVGQGFTPAEFWEVCNCSVVFDDIVRVSARCLAYPWNRQLNAMTRAGCHNQSCGGLHGLGSPGSGCPGTNLSWLVMGYNRKLETWSEEQWFMNASTSKTCQMDKADRLLDPVCKITARVRAETSQTSTWQGELRLNVCIMVETFLRLCSAGMLLHGPMIGYVWLSATVLL